MAVQYFHTSECQQGKTGDFWSISTFCEREHALNAPNKSVILLIYKVFIE
jgi:hypothetical protein